MVRSIHTLGDVRNVGLKLLAICKNPACRRREYVDLDRMIELLGTARPLLPNRLEVHFTDRLRCSRCNEVGAFLWLEVPFDPKPLFDKMGFKVNAWDRSGQHLIGTVAKATHEAVAHEAFTGATSAYPARRITLQEGARVMRDSRLRIVKGGAA